MTLHTLTPFRADKNLGLAYNLSMQMIGQDDWAIFLDHDATWTTTRWHAQFTEAIDFLPDAGAIVAMTNRIASPWQRIGDRDSNDIAAHRAFGAERAKVRTLLDISNTKGWGGVAFAVSKRAWQECGGFAEGYLGCTDHSWHYAMQRIGRKCWLHQGIYVYHWRHWGEPDPTDGSKVPNCPCRGVERQPSERIALP